MAGGPFEYLCQALGTNHPENDSSTVKFSKLSISSNDKSGNVYSSQHKSSVMSARITTMGAAVSKANPTRYTPRSPDVHGKVILTQLFLSSLEKGKGKAIDTE